MAYTYPSSSFLTDTLRPFLLSALVLLSTRRLFSSMFGARRSSSARREGPPGRPTTACWHHVADALRHAAHLVGLGFVVETLILGRAAQHVCVYGPSLLPSHLSALNMLRSHRLTLLWPSPLIRPAHPARLHSRSALWALQWCATGATGRSWVLLMRAASRGAASAAQHGGAR